MDTRSPLDPATVHDLNPWQPLALRRRQRARLVTPAFVGAQWQHVPPVRDPPPAIARARRPARPGTARPSSSPRRRSCSTLSARLTDEQKMIAEYWADGPHSELPPGHWNLFAQQFAASRPPGSSEHDLDRAVKLFFALTNAIFDAGCCAWDNKVAFDSVRPITAIRWLFRGTDGHGLGRPGQRHAADRGRGLVPLPADDASRRRPSPSTRPATATSAPPAPRSCGCSPAATASAARSRSPPAARASSRGSSRRGTSRSPGRPSPTPPHRRASRAATAASTSSRATSTRARPAGPPRGAAGTSPAPTSQGPPRGPA